MFFLYGVGGGQNFAGMSVKFFFLSIYTFPNSCAVPVLDWSAKASGRCARNLQLLNKAKLHITVNSDKPYQDNAALDFLFRIDR